METEKKSIAWGVASLITGIVGGVIFLMPYFGIIFSIFAIVAYGIQNKKGSNGFAVAGLILGILGALINTCMFFLMAFVLMLGL
jgi:hypothetical protein